MNNTKISAEVVADSIDPRGNRLTSLLITFPRIILAEVNTHRMLSKNTSSSRAIPFKKMVESVQNNSFIPIAWQKHHSGMQGSEYFTSDVDIKACRKQWLDARDSAILHSSFMYNDGTTKQLCNRLLEPFMWTTMLITGSKQGWDNFFELRCPRYYGVYKSQKELLVNKVEERKRPFHERPNNAQAEIHMQMLAEEIYDAMNESTPKQLQAGEWHIPFRNKIDNDILLDTLEDNNFSDDKIQNYLIKISTAMGAYTSYTVVGGEVVRSYEKWISLHDRLISQDPPHSSPLEHCARVMDEYEYFDFQKGRLDYIDAYIPGIDEDSTLLDGNSLTSGWCGPYKGFMSYRYLLEEEGLKL